MMILVILKNIVAEMNMKITERMKRNQEIIMIMRQSITLFHTVISIRENIDLRTKLI